MRIIEAPVNLDFYKTFHKEGYRPGTTNVNINFTTRHGKYSNTDGLRTHVGGLRQAVNKLKWHWDQFFACETAEEATELYYNLVSHGLGTPQTVDHLKALWKLGYLPLEIRALAEGEEVPYGVPHFTVENTHADFPWLTGSQETFLSTEIWPVQTALTTAAAYYRTFLHYARATGSPEEFIPFQGHDFSYRGMMGTEAAKMTGLGHLMSGFVGSDTCPAGVAGHVHYGATLDPETPCLTIASVNATEHSVQCSFSDDDGAYIDHCMDYAAPEGILSLVADGYDFWEFVTELIVARKEKILARNGKTVIRPDTGDPVKILTGYFTDGNNYTSEEEARNNAPYPMDEDFDAVMINGVYHPCGWVSEDDWEADMNTVLEDYEVQGLVDFLWQEFGGTTTDKGFNVLDEHIGTIYGDSITLERQDQILRRLMAKGYASCNVVLGIGSYTYQYVTRDTHGSAVKATNIKMDNGENIAIYKDPKTGDGTKKSAKGYLFVYRDIAGDLALEDNVSEEKCKSEENELKLVWKNGEWLSHQTLTNIRETVAKSY